MCALEPSTLPQQTGPAGTRRPAAKKFGQVRARLLPGFLLRMIPALPLVLEWLRVPVYAPVRAMQIAWANPPRFVLDECANPAAHYCEGTQQTAIADPFRRLRCCRAKYLPQSGSRGSSTAIQIREFSPTECPAIVPAAPPCADLTG